ncbi:type II toxin-antitoxin system death-on-curing family toxin [Gigaspora margarita]|uniref:Type II toxin-antitoxin system death-on-curing family toxin n=1 Tax=Gigaspora margarita TaxID=4874 RepID=A0A8H4A2U1_GIGMA|nr:type II toxin-antitoxin system death-on-curing family toxin [Gigaspora margarita]
MEYILRSFSQTHQLSKLFATPRIWSIFERNVERDLSSHSSKRLAKRSIQIYYPKKLGSLFKSERQMNIIAPHYKKCSIDIDNFYNDNEPVWLDLDEFIKMHNLMMKSMGHKQLVRDIGLLESAFQRPKFMFFYDKASIFRMAAGLGESVIKNHAFLDGNKRAGHLAIFTFLLLNGYDLVVDKIFTEKMIINVAKSRINVDMLESWIANSIDPTRPVKTEFEFFKKNYDNKK